MGWMQAPESSSCYGDSWLMDTIQDSGITGAWVGHASSEAPAQESVCAHLKKAVGQATDVVEKVALAPLMALGAAVESKHKPMAMRKVMRAIDIVNSIVSVIQFCVQQAGRFAKFSGLKYCWPAAIFYIPVGLKNTCREVRNINKGTYHHDKEGFFISAASIPANLALMTNAAATSLVGMRMIFDSIKSYTMWAPPLAMFTALTSPIFMFLDLMAFRRSKKLEKEMKGMDDKDFFMYLENMYDRNYSDNMIEEKKLSDRYIKKGMKKEEARNKAWELIMRKKKRWFSRRTGVKLKVEDVRRMQRNKNERSRAISIIRDRTHRKVVGHKLSIIATIVAMVAVAILVVAPAAMICGLSIGALLLSLNAVIFAVKGFYEGNLIFKHKYVPPKEPEEHIIEDLVTTVRRRLVNLPEGKEEKKVRIVVPKGKLKVD
jgi:hypothetical protein